MCRFVSISVSINDNDSYKKFIDLNSNKNLKVLNGLNLDEESSKLLAIMRIQEEL